MTTITLQPDHAYVLASIAGMVITNFVLGGTVGPARSKYGVKYPNLYATRGMYIKDDGKVDEQAWLEKGTKFNQVQRGHQHMTETYPEALAMLITCGVFYPRYAAQWAVMWIVGTVGYAVGYSISPNYRLFGEMFYIPANIGWLYGLYCAGKALHAGTAF